MNFRPTPRWRSDAHGEVRGSVAKSPPAACHVVARVAACDVGGGQVGDRLPGSDWTSRGPRHAETGGLSATIHTIAHPPHASRNCVVEPPLAVSRALTSAGSCSHAARIRVTSGGMEAADRWLSPGIRCRSSGNFAATEDRHQASVSAPPQPALAATTSHNRSIELLDVEIAHELIIRRGDWAHTPRETTDSPAVGATGQVAAEASNSTKENAHVHGY